MAEVTSVNISEKKGTVKHPVPEIVLRCRHGIVGDAHAGDWHRQISMLSEESVDKMRAALPQLKAGAFAENINTRGIDLKRLPVGTRLRIGETVVETRSARSATTTAPLRRPPAPASCPQRASSWWW